MSSALQQRLEENSKRGRCSFTNNTTSTNSKRLRGNAFQPAVHDKESSPSSSHSLKTLFNDAFLLKLNKAELNGDASDDSGSRKSMPASNNADDDSFDSNKLILADTIAANRQRELQKIGTILQRPSSPLSDDYYQKGREEALSLLNDVMETTLSIDAEEDDKQLMLADSIASTRQCELQKIGALHITSPISDSYQKGREEALSLLHDMERIESSKTATTSTSFDSEENKKLMLADTISAKRQRELQKFGFSSSMMSDLYQKGREEALSLLNDAKPVVGSEEVETASAIDSKDDDKQLMLADSIAMNRHRELQNVCALHSSSPLSDSYQKGREEALSLLSIDFKKPVASKEALAIDSEESKKLMLADSIAANRQRELQKIGLPNISSSNSDSYQKGREEALSLLQHDDVKPARRKEVETPLAIDSEEDDKQLMLADSIASTRQCELQKISALLITSPISDSYQKGREEALSLLHNMERIESSKTATTSDNFDSEENKKLMLADTISVKRQRELQKFGFSSSMMSDLYQKGREEALSLLSDAKPFVGSKEVETALATASEEKLMLADTIAANRHREMQKTGVSLISSSPISDSYQKGREEALSLLHDMERIESSKTATTSDNFDSEENKKLMLADTISAKRQRELQKFGFSSSMMSDLYQKGREEALSLLNDTQPVRSKEGETTLAIDSEEDDKQLMLADSIAMNRHRELQNVCALHSSSPLSDSYQKGRKEALSLLKINVKKPVERKEAETVLAIDSEESKKLMLADSIAANRQRELQKIGLPNISSSNSDSYQKGREAALSLLQHDDVKKPAARKEVETPLAIDSEEDDKQLMLADSIAANRQRELQKIGLPNISSSNSASYRRGREEALSLLQHDDAKPRGRAELKTAARQDQDSTQKMLASATLCSTNATSAVAKEQQQQQQDVNTTMTTTSVATLLSKRKRTEATLSFPEKLYAMMMDIEKGGWPEMVAFLPHGRAFTTGNVVRLISETLPKYFGQSRRCFLERQLEVHGFAKITSGPDKGAYFHELFRKDRPDLISRIQRRKTH